MLFYHFCDSDEKLFLSSDEKFYRYISPPLLAISSDPAESIVKEFGTIKPLPHKVGAQRFSKIGRKIR